MIMKACVSIGVIVIFTGLLYYLYRHQQIY